MEIVRPPGGAPQRLTVPADSEENVMFLTVFGGGMEKPAFYAIVGVSLIVTAVSLGYSASRYLSTRFYSPLRLHTGGR
jgi:hypothetical protein